MSIQKEDSLQERQDNELQVLQSIFMDDLKDLRQKNAWKIEDELEYLSDKNQIILLIYQLLIMIRRPLELLMTLQPQQSMTVCREIHVQVDLYVQCTSDYPNKIPRLELKNAKGLSIQNIKELQQQLINLANKLKGEVMIYELAQYVQNYLHQHNKRQFESFYEEMLHNQKCTEEKEAEANKRKQEIQKLREYKAIQEEIQRKQEALKKEARRRRESHRQASISDDSDTEEHKNIPGKQLQEKLDNHLDLNEDVNQGIKNNQNENLKKECDSDDALNLLKEISEHSRLHKEFEILKWLGSGGFGDVLKVKNKLDGGIYAIKRIPLNPSNKQLNRKIMREVKLLSSLNHENVVRYYHSWIETATEVAQDDKEDSSGTAVLDSDSSVDNKKLNSGLSDIEKLAPPMPETSIEWSVSYKHNSNLQDDEDDDLSEDDDVFGMSFLHFSDSSDDSICFEESEKKSEKCDDKSSLTQDNDSQVCKKEGMITFQYMFIQMEFCEKSTLRTAIDEGLHSDNQRLWRLFREIIEGLCHIHQQGMIHRDLKPVNIFLDSNDHVKIGDFGLATTDILPKAVSSLECGVEGRVLDHNELSRFEVVEDYTKTGQVGTALYVAPELIAASSSRIVYNHKVDIYSLGIIFFEMCYPRLSTGMERVKLLASLRLPEIVFPTNVDENLSPQQIYLIKWLLRHDVANRPTSFELLASDYMPPPQMEEAELNEMLRHIVSNSQSKAYKRMVNTIFKQETTVAADVTYDMDLHKVTPFSQSAILMNTVDILERIMQKHGAIICSVPTLMPKSFVYENNEWCVNVMDHRGGIVTLPYDLRVPFARYVARREITNLKWYTLGKVFRERKVFGFHPRELYECAFDIVTPNPGGFLPDAEVLKVVSEIITEIPALQSRAYVIHMNHVSLLKAVLIHCAIPEEKYQAVYTILADTKKGNINRSHIHTKLINLGLSEQSVASLCHFTDLHDHLPKIESYFLSIIKRKNAAASLAKQGLRDLKSVIANSHSLAIKNPIFVTPGLVYNIHLFSGVMFQFKCELKRNHPKGGMDVLAAGGRYDRLITSFSTSSSGKEVSQSAVGVSIAVEKIVSAIAENDEFQIPSRIDVLVCSIGNKSMIKDKCTVLQELWACGIRSYVIYDTAQTLEEITEFCQEHKIPHIIILKDSDCGVIKVRTLDKDRFSEKNLPPNELIDYILKNMNKGDQAENLKSEINRSYSFCENSSSSPLVNISFLTKEKISFSSKKRSEIQIMSQLTPVLQCLSSRIKVEILAVDLPSTVIKTIVSQVDFEKENEFEESISTVIEKHAREKKYLIKLMDQIHELRFEKKCPVLALYSLVNNRHKIIM